MIKKSLEWMLLLVSCMAFTSRQADSRGQTLDFPSAGIKTEKQMKTEDSVSVITGKLIIGHEVRSLMVDGDSTEYWFIDRSGNVEQEYERVVPEGIKSYTPVRVEMKVKYLGKSDEGFAAEYDGVYEILELLKMEP